MAVGDEEIFREFLVESTENLDQLDRDFVALESSPGATNRVAAIFRTIHTIKGTSGFLGLSKLEALAHEGENVLSKIRDGKLTLTPEITSTLLSMVDGVRRILKCVESTRSEGSDDYSPIRAKLASFCAVRVQPIGEILIEAGVIQPKDLEEALEQQKQDPRKIGEILVSRGSVLNASAISDALQAQREMRAAASDTSIRVDVGLLDKLMNLVGELVLARNQILQFAGQSKDSSFVGTSQRLNLITTELQEGVMKTRMQPIGNVWNKFPRVVRDLALTCGKQVKLEMIGEETDLDRTIIEAIKDPLTHLVRNSVDHGIETPEVRIARGKTAHGKLLLRAYHEGGQVNIEISDDGAGIDPEKIRDKAVARGLVTQDRAARMSDRESLNLIFLAGFSTAEKVTSVSGRGVGMDVVKTNVEKIGGTVDVQSKAGQGTTLKIKIPLTLAIIPALVVTSYTERFAIPQVNLLELVRLDREQVMEHIHGAPVYRLRGNILPLVFLNRTLGLPEKAFADSGATHIVVLQADDRQFGLVVDGVSDTEEIVVKPLGKELKGLSVFAGATIMGDGRVALILDVLGIAQRANVISEIRDRNLADERKELGHNGHKEEERRAVLLFRIREAGRMAIPLSMVARLEEFPRERLERSRGRHVMQYRGRILPLIDLCGMTDHGGDQGDAPLQVIVYSEQGRSVGLVVDRILDIVEESFTQELRAASNGVIGSAVIGGKVTDLLDVHGVIRATDPEFFERTHAA
ncbi:MAG: chemotaxis protein CheW [Polyangiaceae bacterium]|jgi:two-component system chemotaxis sensor kinase CheA